MKKIGTVLIIGSLAFLILHFAADYYATDMCLDSGKIYDYALGQCRDDIDHLPYIPISEKIQLGNHFFSTHSCYWYCICSQGHKTHGGVKLSTSDFLHLFGIYSEFPL